MSGQEVVVIMKVKVKGEIEGESNEGRVTKECMYAQLEARLKETRRAGRTVVRLVLLVVLRWWV